MTTLVENFADRSFKRALSSANGRKTSLSHTANLHRACCGRLFQDLWEVNRECTAFARLARDDDVAAVAPDNALHDGEAQAGAFVVFLGRKESVENMGARFPVHAYAGIGDVKSNIGARRHNAVFMRDR